MEFFCGFPGNSIEMPLQRLAAPGLHDGPGQRDESLPGELGSGVACKEEDPAAIDPSSPTKSARPSPTAVLSAGLVVDHDDWPAKRTIYRWLEKHADFAQKYALAREMQAE